MSILQLATLYFIVTNPIGNSPAIIALIKDHDIRGQQKILFRESMFSMILAIFFLFLGETFLGSLNIANYALTISGGILLFIVSLHMIFSFHKETANDKPKRDPFIVPIATPLLSGAGLLTIIMLTSQQEKNDFHVLMAIIIAWIGVTAVLVLAPYMQLMLGKRGMIALEQLMGIILTMIAIQMIVKGSSLFLTALTG